MIQKKHHARQIAVWRNKLRGGPRHAPTSYPSHQYCGHCSQSVHRILSVKRNISAWHNQHIRHTYMCRISCTHLCWKIKSRKRWVAKRIRLRGGVYRGRITPREEGSETHWYYTMAIMSVPHIRKTHTLSDWQSHHVGEPCGNPQLPLLSKAQLHEEANKLTAQSISERNDTYHMRHLVIHRYNTVAIISV